MAAVTRQPFAPLDGTRLQNLTSIKNRQNAVSPSSGAKRKADLVDTDDSENVDPSNFSKRSKPAKGLFSDYDVLRKPTNYVLKASSAATTPFRDISISSTLSSPTKPSSASTLSPSRSSRSVLQPKSPAARLNTAGIAKSSPLSAPAGRSPTRGKRSGILSSRRRTAGPYTRIDPPSFSLSGGAEPFSLDAALKGTIPSYAARSSTSTPAAAPVPAPAPITREAALAAVSTRDSALEDLHEPEMKAAWFFDIHEDTPEQEMTNMLQHGTCVLDISSDEESEEKATRDRAEGRDKENVPPADDVSQTTSRLSAAVAARQASEDDMIFEKQRTALGEMDATTFYATGCDESSVFVVPEDEEEQQQEQEQEQEQAAPVPQPPSFGVDYELKSEEEKQPEMPSEPAMPTSEVSCKDAIDELMGKSDEAPAKAAVLEPMEGTGETFELWESSSSKDETETAAVAA